jgi:lysophospholipase L1-like esterase
MWGTGVDDAATIPAYFNRLHPEFRVLNHAESAFTSRQALARLITLLSQGHELDVVVFFDGANDVAQQCRRGVPVPGHSRVGQIREALSALRRQGSLRVAVLHVLDALFVRYTVALARSLRGPAATEGGLYDCEESPDKAKRVAEVLFRNWEIAHSIVTARGGRFVAILQPTAHSGSPRTDHLPGLNDELGANIRTVYPLIQAEIEDSRHAWIHDFTDAYDGDAGPMLLIDDFHVVAEGNEIIARRIGPLVDTGDPAAASR